MDILSIRSHFLAVHPASDLVQWFDPLSFSYDDVSQCCTVIFPHQFFADWFFKTSIKKLDHGLAAIPSIKTVQYAIETAGNLITIQQADGSAPSEKKISLPDNISLNPTQNFTNFITNKKNFFQVQVIRNAIDQYPNILYNPIVIMGPSGTGKTHLLNAMANCLNEKNILFFHGKARQLVNNNIEFLTFFNTKIFLIDDLQAIRENKELQLKFLHFFDHSQTQNVLAVVSIDSHPATYSGLSNKIRMRLTGGVLLELKKPDLGIRLKYILQQSEDNRLSLSKETALSLAQRHNDFRSINGALTTLQAYRKIACKDTGELPNLLGTETIQKILSPKDIIRQVAKYYNIPLVDITGKKRNKKISTARQISIFLCRELTGITLAQIGEVFGGRDHSSIVYTIKKIQLLQQSNEDMNNQITQLKKMCLTIPWT